MRQVSKIFAIAIVLMAFSASMFAQDTESVSASATIISPITLTKNTDLNFGYIAPGTVAGSVTIVEGATPSRSASNCVIYTSGAFSGFTQAQLTVGGNLNAAYSLTISSGTVSLTGTGPAMTATLTNTSASGTTTLDATGSDIIYIGGTLDLDNSTNQTAGAYTGSFNVTVDYE